MSLSVRIAITISFLLILVPDHVLAQQNRNNFLGAGFGLGDLHLRDDLASSLIFRSAGIAPSLQYYNIKDKSRQSAEASYWYNNLKSSQDNFSTQNYAGRVRYSYVHSLLNVKMFTHDMNILLGGSVSSFFNCSAFNYEIAYNSTVGRANTSWYWCHSLDMSVQMEYDLAPGKFLTFQLYVPMISNVSRPSYSSSGDYNYTKNRKDIDIFGKTIFFPENISFNPSIAYQFPLSEKLYLQLKYEFYLADYEYPCEMKMYMNTLRGGMFFHF